MGLFKPTFSISQMTETKLAWAMPWRENEGEANVFVNPEDQRELARFGLARKGLEPTSSLIFFSFGL